MPKIRIKQDLSVGIENQARAQFYKNCFYRRHHYGHLKSISHYTIVIIEKKEKKTTIQVRKWSESWQIKSFRYFNRKCDPCVRSALRQLFSHAGSTDQDYLTLSFYLYSTIPRISILNQTQNTFIAVVLIGFLPLKQDIKPTFIS